MSINDALQNISTIIVTEAPGISGQGTGFFYSRLAPTEKEALNGAKSTTCGL